MAFMEHCSFGEAPKHMYFWAGVSAVAGAIRRQAWIDQKLFKWYCNLYTVIVAPPGIVAKSTTSALAMDLLKKVPGIKFGPDIVTWQALIEAFEDSEDNFEYAGQFWPQSALNFDISEFGNFLDPNDKRMVDLLVALWDGKQGGMKKKSKSGGEEVVQNPWINLIACTTPSWIADNFPKYMIGGGFTSRCVFLYAEQKAQFVAYPEDHAPANFEQQEAALVADLDHISRNIVGPYTLTPDAKKWGRAWYKSHWEGQHQATVDPRFGGYIARKQTMLHKVAMIIAAAQSDVMQLEAEHLAIAARMLTDLEPDMEKIYEKIGKAENSDHIDRLIFYVRKRGTVSFAEAYAYVHSYFPELRKFEDIVAGLVRSGKFTIKGGRTSNESAIIVWVGGE